MARATLFEELLLLYAYSTPDGVSRKANRIQLALGAAVLAELALAGRIRVDLAEPDGVLGPFSPSKDVISVVDPTPLGDSEADAVLEFLPQRSDKSPKQWVYNASQSVDQPWKSTTIQERLVDRFIADGAFRPLRRKVLGLFPIDRYVLTDPSTANHIRGNLDQLLSGATPDPHTAALALLILEPRNQIIQLGFSERPSRDTKALCRSLSDGHWGTAAQRQSVGALIEGIRSWKRS